METKNPFIVSGKIQDEYFCDRVEEKRLLIQQIVGQSSNILLMAERRIGKTGLIDHCYSSPEIANQFYTFYFDILHTSSLQEFVYEFGKEVFARLMPYGQQIIQSLTQSIRSIRPTFSLDPFSGMPTFSLEIGSVTQPEYSLEEILSWLEHADKPCIVAIDEFQRIGKYPDKNVEALLRGHIQHMGNCHFIFSGSERHLLSEMFQTCKRPFYHSTTTLSLQAIDIDRYRPFAQYWMEQGGHSLDNQVFDSLYHLFDGNTFCIQKLLHTAYDLLAPNEACTTDTLRQCLHDILDNNTITYRESLSRMTTKQKSVLIAIASEGKAQKITSGAFLRKHNLESASMVQTAIKWLLGDEWISTKDQTYFISDPFFLLWLQKTHFGYINF